MMYLIILRRGNRLGCPYCHEVVQFRDNTARLKQSGCLGIQTSNSSSDRDRAVSVKHDSIG